MSKHIWYVDARISTEAIVSIVAESEDEARERFHNGAWHSVKPKGNMITWDHGRAEVLIDIQKGPHIN